MASQTLSAVDALLEDEHQWQLQDNPEFASQSGDNRFCRELQDLSPEAFTRRHKHNEELLVKACALADQFHDAVPLNLRLLIQNVRDEQEAFDLCAHLYPVNSIGYGGVHNNFVESLDWLPDGPEGHEAFVSRLQKFTKQAAGYQELLRKGVSSGHVASRAMLRGVPQQLADMLAQLDASPPTGPIGDRLAALSEEQRASGTEALALFRAAVAELARFFEAEYIPHARTVVGARGLPGGEALYALCLRYHTTTSMSPADVHAKGLAEVARIEKRFQAEVLDVLGFKGTFAAFAAQCKADPANHFTDPEELLAGYRDLCGHITKLLPGYFSRSPAAPLEIVAKDAASAPAAYYMQGTADGKRPGKFYVNVSNLSARPKYNMTALALHEGIPGHHHQGSLAIENDSLPSFLRFLEDRRYEFCPARRQIYAAYLEGWALYCEALGEEMGLYSADPLRLFGRLSMEMMRAVRLVVDTGIHSQGWSIEEAVEYMSTKTGMHSEECEAECYRYEAWPGQACAYKVGEIALWEMRRKAEGALSGVEAGFDLKAFHDVVLDHGPLPLSQLAVEVERWTHARLAQGKDDKAQ